jgi:hypothetical protein
MLLTAKHGVATPVNWKQGEDVVIPAALSNENAAKNIRRDSTRCCPICVWLRSLSKPPGQHPRCYPRGYITDARTDIAPAGVVII